jgi:hypothetical protein
MGLTPLKSENMSYKGGIPQGEGVWYDHMTGVGGLRYYMGVCHYLPYGDKDIHSPPTLRVNKFIHIV